MGGQAGDFEGISSELKRRGVNASLRSLLTACSLDGIVRSIQAWDERQSDERAPGPGALVETIRRGGVVAQVQESSCERSLRALDQFAGWCHEQLSDLCPASTGIELPIGAFQWWFRHSNPTGEGLTAVDAAGVRRSIEAFNRGER